MDLNSVIERDLKEYHKLLNEPRKVAIPRFWVHIGADELHKEWVRPIRNSFGFNKPLGGVWASPLSLEDGHISDWHSASISMGFGQPTKACILEFKKNARICVIDSQADLIRLADEVGLQQPPFDFEIPLSIKTVDFIKVAEKYDVLYLTDRGQWATRIPRTNSEYNLYGWDCESCVIFNFDIINSQRGVKLTKRK